MYGVVLLAALCGAEEAAAWDGTKCYPPPVVERGGYPGYHNPGGWGRPYGGYGWTGYYCPANQHHGPPMLTLPDEPLFVPPPPRPDDEDDEDAEPSKADKSGTKKNGDKKKEDKKKDGEEETASVPKLGLGLASLSAAKRKSLVLADDHIGVAVTAAGAKSLAYKGGLREGMLILSVDGDPVTSAKQATDLIRQGSLRQGIRLRVIADGERSTVVLTE